MKLTKLTLETLPETISFEYDEACFSEPVRVQGASKRDCGDMLLIDSEKRYKLFTQSCDYVRILSGGGSIKWARGELPFSADDIFCFDQAGEYELNGKCRFLVVRK